MCQSRLISVSQTLVHIDIIIWIDAACVADCTNYKSAPSKISLRTVHFAIMLLASWSRPSLLYQIYIYMALWWSQPNRTNYNFYLPKSNPDKSQAFWSIISVVRSCILDNFSNLTPPPPPPHTKYCIYHIDPMITSLKLQDILNHPLRDIFWNISLKLTPTMSQLYSSLKLSLKFYR